MMLLPKKCIALNLKVSQNKLQSMELTNDVDDDDLSLIIGPYVNAHTILYPLDSIVAGYFAIGGLWEILPDIIRMHTYNTVNLRNMPTENVRSKISNN